MVYSVHMKYIIGFFIGMSLWAGGGYVVLAQELVQNTTGIVRAKVIEIISDQQEQIPGTETFVPVQEIQVRILDESFENKEITLINDYQNVKKGKKVFLKYLIDNSGNTLWVVHDIERRGSLWFLIGLFALMIVGFGKVQGIRSLFSLGASFAAIFLVLTPLLVRGYPPILTSIIIAVIILFFAIFVTHGFHKRSSIAFLGTIISVLFTGLLAWFATSITSISGFAEHEAVYLNFNTGGTLDFTGLFLAGILIGVLGILDDIAVTQVAVVRELYAVAKKETSLLRIYRGAIRVGKEHVSALVNTLVLAYAGVSLPAILFFSTATNSFGMIMNQEVFAAEIVRTVVGTIGLILTVPITTGLAVWMLKDTRGKELSEEELHFGHSHGHDHHHA